jgi:hypothetical protein
VPNFRRSFAESTENNGKVKGRVLNYPLRLVAKADEESDSLMERLHRLGGYSVIPNGLLDLLRGSLSRNQYDVFMYIVRRTLGFHKTGDAISLSQFQYGLVNSEGRRLDFGCGIRRVDTITQTLRELESLGYITIEHKKAVNGATLPNSYTVCLAKVLETIEDFGEKQPENHFKKGQVCRRRQ